MDFKGEVKNSLQKAQGFVLEGSEQILTGRLDEAHGVSVSPGATALASLALLALGRGFETAQQKGVRWLWQHRQGHGWGKFPGDNPDEEITKIVNTVLQGSQSGWLSKIMLLMQARQFSHMILSLGERVVPGLEGPTPEEIKLPNILEESVLRKLPIYGRPVVVAAALLAAQDNQNGIREGMEYLEKHQMPDGSWAEDIVATSMGILAILRHKGNNNNAQRAGRWLVQKQYASGGWPAFDQLQTWAIGWAVNIFSELDLTSKERQWISRMVEWLKNGENTDGSYGSTPPFTHPDLDDTAVALSGLHQALRTQNQSSIQLLKRLQNKDGSWGTFPSFKGVPPNIQSEFPVYIISPDVTIHVLEALWRQNTRSQDPTIWRGLNWLLQQQQKDGFFEALWFEGPFYCTAQVLELLSKWHFNWQQWRSARKIVAARKKAFDFLMSEQNDQNGWGVSLVETALVTGTLCRFSNRLPKNMLDGAIQNIIAKQRSDGSFEPCYKGIYAKGWNYEEPMAAALTAIRALDRYLKI